MKLTGVSLTIAFVFALLAFDSHAQSCTTGTVDERLSSLLKASPGYTMEQLKAMPVDKLREDLSMGIRKLPEDSVKRVTLKDNIRINVVRASSAQGLPVVIHFHDGGFVRPLLPSMEYEAMRIAKQLGVLVLDVDYRVAPEYKFPTAANDAFAAYLWALEKAKDFGGDGSNIILAGTGSGANLAATTALRAKKEGKLDPLRLVMMTCAPTDNPMISYYASYEDNATGYLLSKDESIFNFQAYLDKTEWFRNDPGIWPIYEKDLTGMPPHLIITTEFDIFRDEGIAYGKKLEQAGNVVAIKCFPHQLHAFVGLPENAPERQRVYELMRESLKTTVKK